MQRAHLVLIGYRGTGKSTVAQRLAEVLSKPFRDSDVEVVLRAGKSIREIFETDGEPVFRELEAQVLRKILEGSSSVVATGGGVVLRADNCRLLSEAGWVVWLRARPDTIIGRMEADAATAAGRPALTASGVAGEVESVLRTRTPLYEACADETVDTDNMNPSQIAAEIVARLAHRLGEFGTRSGEQA